MGECEYTSNTSDWTFGDLKIRDGRYGPVTTGLKTDGKLFTAELLEPGSPQAVQSLVAYLNSRQMDQPSAPHPHTVSYLGFEQNEDKTGVYILTEYPSGGTLSESLRDLGAVDRGIAQIYLRRLVLGLEELKKRGLATVFLNSGNIFIHVASDTLAGLKIEAPHLDISVAGCALPPGIVTLPEVVLAQSHMRKADVWLLGIVAAEILTGECPTAASAGRIATQVGKQKEGSAWELFVPGDVAGKLDELAVDFLRNCFIV